MDINSYLIKRTMRLIVGTFMCLPLNLLYASSPFFDVSLDPKTIDIDAVAGLFEKYDVFEKQGDGQLSIENLAQMMDLRESQKRQLLNAAKSDVLDVRCYTDSELEPLYCELTGELSEPVSILMDQLDVMGGSPTISFAKNIQIRMKQTKKQNTTTLDFCLIRGISGSLGVGGKVNGALVELTEGNDGSKSVSGFFDLGYFGTYGNQSAQCLEEGLPVVGEERLQTRGYIETKGCAHTMIFLDKYQWERSYLSCPGSLLCLNTKKTDWCETSSGRIASTPRIQYECVIGDGSFANDLSRVEKVKTRSLLRTRLKEKEDVSTCCNSSEEAKNSNMYSATSTTLPEECYL